MSKELGKVIMIGKSDMDKFKEIEKFTLAVWKPEKLTWEFWFKFLSIVGHEFNASEEGKVYDNLNEIRNDQSPIFTEQEQEVVNLLKELRIIDDSF